MVIPEKTGQEKWPDVIKLKACVKHRFLRHANRLAHLQGECEDSTLAKKDEGDEVKRESAEMKQDDIETERNAAIEDACLSQ